MGALDAAVVVQPRLIVPPAIQARIASGELYRVGSVVRYVASKQFVTFLDEAPVEELVEDAVRQFSRLEASKAALSKIDLAKLDPKVVAGLFVVGTLATGTGYVWVKKKRKASEAQSPEEVLVEELAADEVGEVPECVSDFRASLEAYVEAGSNGALDADVVAQLISAVDAVRAYSAEGNAVYFTLDELVPFFDMVTPHTPALAEAYSFDLEHDLRDSAAATEGATVSHLRRHLEAQKRILSSVA